LVRAAVLRRLSPDPEVETDDDGNIVATVERVGSPNRLRLKPMLRPPALNRRWSHVSGPASNLHSQPSNPLRLVLEESGDESADQARLARVFDLLRAHPGDDLVLLTILTREGDEVDVALPGAEVSDALHSQLKATLRGALSPGSALGV
jgi:hypothetical protein